MNNLELLEYCKKNPEKFLDKNYMFVDKHKELPLYVLKTKNIKNKLIAIRELLDKKGAIHITDQLFTDLQKELNKHSNFSEFISFVNACDSRLEEVKNDMDLLKQTTFLYLQYRDLNDIVPSEWVQALVDKSTSRKKGHSGEKKLMNLLDKKGYKLVHNLKDFDNHQCGVAQFTNKGDFSNKNLRKVFNIKIGKSTQNKKLDLLIKNKNGVYFLEAKHLNSGGGGQDKQIKELIDVIKNGSDQHHFVAFLDGIYSNTILTANDSGSVSPKVKAQHRDVLKALRTNRGNYWVNTNGFQKLFS